MSAGTQRRFDQALVAALAVAALDCFFRSASTMIEWTPRVLYADQWRQYLKFLTVDFPANVFLPDNGHRLVLPNVVAWIDATAFGGEHVLQLALGWTAVVAAIAIAATACLRDRDLAPPARAAGASLAVFAVIWLGCSRTLAHTGELVHVYPTIAFALGAIACAWRASTSPRGMRWTVAALVLAFAATNTIGYGLAAFVGVVVALVLARAPRRLLAAAVAGLAVGASYYLGSAGGGDVTDSLTVEPLANLVAAARWLGMPVNTIVPSLWYEDAAYHVPGTVQPAARAIGAWLRAHVAPDIALAAWPQALAGFTGIALTLVLSRHAWRAAQAPTRTRVFGLAVAWFGLAAAGIVSLSRLAYFREYPIQIYADRYQPWPMLFWLGVAFAVFGGRHANRAAPRAFAVATLGLMVAAIPGERAARVTTMVTRGHVDNTAAGAAVGVLPQGADFGETWRDDLVAGIPALKAADQPPFSWPETKLLGADAPADARRLEGRLASTPVDNLLQGPGLRVDLAVPAGTTPPWRAALVDARRRVVGIVVRDERFGASAMTGYARGTEPPVEAVVLR